MYGDELQGFRFDKEIGKGAFSKVYLATKKILGKDMQLKE